MKIKGYKSFNSNGTNVAGNILFPGKYHCDGEIKFGPHGNGYHFALKMEDTIRFSDYDCILKNPMIAEVIGTGIIKEGYDEYNGYYDMYVCSDLEIIRFLNREEIISLALNLSNERMKRFISQFRLLPEEICLFENISLDIDLALDYYQRGIKDAYYTNNKYDKFKLKRL